MRVRRPDGSEGYLVVSVPADGAVIHASLGETAIVLGPEDAQRLRRIYQEAAAVALWNQGHW